MQTHPPFLESFYREERGTVYFKGYPPYRADDMQSVVELARILPHQVNFIPIPPVVPHVGDLRHLLQAVLDLIPEIDPAQFTRPDSEFDPFSLLAESLHAKTRHVPVPALTPEREEEIQQAVFQLVEESLPSSRRSQSRTLLDAIRRRPLYRVLENTVASTLYGPIDQLSYVPIVPDEGPILVIGRPELFHHAARFDMTRNPLALQNVLHDAGYPNRFDFLMKPNGLILETNGIRDRKTNMCHLVQEWYSDDVGFVFSNNVADGRTVIVAAGTTAFGTLAAVRLLSEKRPAFSRAMQHQSQQLDVGKSAAIDLAFRCHHVRSREAMLFPFSQPSQALTILPLNGRDMLGFRWNRRVHELFEWLFDWWTPKPASTNQKTFAEKGPGQMQWTCEARPSDPQVHKSPVVNVTIDAEAWVCGRHEILAGRKMVKVLAAIRQQLLEDLQAWYFRMHRRHMITGQETFRPVLLIGETGTGKTIVSECIGEIWSGSTLEKIADDWPRGEQKVLGDGTRPNALLDAARDELDLRLNCWPESEPTAGSRTLTFSPVSSPETMLDKELFGSAAGFATTAGPAPGVFLLAGSGVLFLDELLELPLDQQARLLVALQKGWVRPLGSGRDYSFRCRLVVATNRAATMQELEELAESEKLNQALIARLKYRYELPPLRERSEIIMPLLINLIQERAVRDGIRRAPNSDPANRPPVWVRISRPALEALLGYDFPENVRDVERLVNQLPRGLIESFGIPWKPERDRSSFDATLLPAIKLEHLNVLQVARSAINDEGTQQTGESPEAEIEFYQFTLKLKRFSMKPDAGEWQIEAERKVRIESIADLRRDYAPAMNLLYGETPESVESRLEEMSTVRNRVAASLMSADSSPNFSAIFNDPVTSERLKSLCERWLELPSDDFKAGVDSLTELLKFPARPDWSPGKLDGSWYALRRVLPLAPLFDQYQSLIARRNQIAQASKSTENEPVPRTTKGRRAETETVADAEEPRASSSPLNDARNAVKSFSENFVGAFRAWKKEHLGSNGDAMTLLNGLLGMNCQNLR